MPVTPLLECPSLNKGVQNILSCAPEGAYTLPQLSCVLLLPFQPQSTHLESGNHIKCTASLRIKIIIADARGSRACQHSVTAASTRGNWLRKDKALFWLMGLEGLVLSHLCYC